MILADTHAIAILTSRTPSTIRTWAHRGRLTRRGTDWRGRALYSLDDAEAILDQQRRRVQHLEAQRTTAP